MSIQSVNSPTQTFTDIDGQPLENGYIYVGIAGLAAQTNQTSVYWDSDKTIAATQPIRTSGGYPMQSGSPGTIYVDSNNYSIQVNNKNGSTVLSDLNKRSLSGGESVAGVNTLPLTWTDGGNLILDAFYTDIEGGGGNFYWDSTGDKALHDGGTIIDPVVARATSTGTSITAAYFTAGTGVGIWRRRYDSAIIIRWFGARGLDTDDALPIQQAITFFPYSDLLLTGEGAIFGINSQITIPNAASYHLIGDQTFQPNNQVKISAKFNGTLFLAPALTSVFISYSNIRFQSNYSAYPLGVLFEHLGDSVYCNFTNLIIEGFGLPAIQTTGSTNVCKFTQILGAHNKDYVMDLKNCVACDFDRITIDNNDGGGFKVLGANCTFSNLYSEDSCKRNVSEGTTFREFWFGGGNFDIGPISINSFAGNSTIPIELFGCNSTILKNVRQGSLVAPSYSHDITNGPTGLSGFTMISCLDISVENPTDQVIVIEPGYTGGFDTTLSTNGVNIAAENGTWTPAFVNIGSGTYTSQVGSYVKIGSLVTVTCNIDINVLGTASGVLTISGLPFTINATVSTSPTSSAVIGNGWGVDSESVAGSGVVGGTTINILKDNNSATFASVLHSDLSTGSISFSLTYKV